MSYKVFARKWRPKIFAEVAGQKSIVQTLQYALRLVKFITLIFLLALEGLVKLLLLEF